ncbi:hypothetical protein B0A50_06967 [Salinomyces thailandicus]|uniref:Metallo-beta-lactamase domain-containing protein n=1 Tax=Salinomyces thailandicus TaxID=706561 RepID=A0A4U0TPV1_9PEZI|nr:hypothetical protein B0A50_06967 [Salinomyces thailandica]
MLFKRKHARSKKQAGSADTTTSLRLQSARHDDFNNDDAFRPPFTVDEPTPRRPLDFTDAIIHPFHSASIGPTTSYLIADKLTLKAMIIDPILNPSNPGISTASADQILKLIQTHKYTIDRILETNGPAQTPSATWYLRGQLLQYQGFAPYTCTGKSFAGIQRMFRRKYAASQAGPEEVSLGGNIEADLEDGQTFELGSLRVRVMKLPATTPEHMGFLIDSNVFISDSMLVAGPEAVRASRCRGEMLEGLWASVRGLISLPGETSVYCGQLPQGEGEMGGCVRVEEVRAMYRPADSNEE